ncbi:A2 [Alcelaphine gammaherpesvirus 1]|uniref:Uncharacterized protein A2 n=2 Tax=Alcelaphine gammaherpesvirus 1 TaxID=35252 RepID=VGA2_ALHV1|nr:A2 [Alcelaphine gammaherpesvirus 1]O42037.1 RecName: Full=Uncharacterized protein A2 [Alcelaphine herpesvirus 1 strain C500]AAC58051.1 A2 [Alcelaphine gammaherpesvirus 1]AAC58053.1 A2 [Alcelaphine gammaherpesvirus 1]APB09431.1 protein A2 [Alcelaphine gammaherpesvirus 1]APB09503.1 protein A2 [Alcelaphine gammaherpesvirus 1]
MSQNSNSENPSPRKKRYVKMCDLTEEQKERRRSINRRASKNFLKRRRIFEEQQEKGLINLKYENSRLRCQVEKRKDEIRILREWLNYHKCTTLQNYNTGPPEPRVKVENSLEMQCATAFLNLDQQYTTNNLNIPETVSGNNTTNGFAAATATLHTNCYEKTLANNTNNFEAKLNCEVLPSFTSALDDLLSIDWNNLYNL